MSEFAGRLALVSGAASGIGLATARRLAAEGARLVLVDRDAPGLDRARKELGTATVRAEAGDVADEHLWEALAPSLEGLAYAVVNAGIAGSATIAEQDFGRWREILSVNLDGAFLTLRAAMRAIVDGGSIVVTASVSGLKAEPGTGAYGASKAALIHLAKVAAKEGAPRRVRVNSTAPGGVETPVWRDMAWFSDRLAELGSEEAAFAAIAEAGTPLGRFAKPDEIAGQILYLLSDDSAFTTGAVLVSDGGYSI